MHLLKSTLTFALLLSGCATVPGSNARLVAGATLSSPDGSQLGTAVLAQDEQGLILTLLIAGLAPGSVHGAHLHTVGACQGPAFASAGPHLNPGGRQHGQENPAGSHLGDLPNLTLTAAGAGRLTTRFAGDPAMLRAQLFDADGTALVLHAAADDLRTDPSGNSGARIACGVLLPAAR